MMTKKGSTEIVNFMTPVFVLGCCNTSHTVEMHYFFKNIFLYTTMYRSDKLSVCIWE